MQSFIQVTEFCSEGTRNSRLAAQTRFAALHASGTRNTRKTCFPVKAFDALRREAGDDQSATRRHAGASRHVFQQRTVMFAYLIVVAVSAFIPYVATPAAEAGVKAIVSHHNDMETGDAPVTPTLVAQDAPVAPVATVANAQPREAH
ncbi:hypothetical protein AN416_26050 [Paraburkholderia caribensis]|nr:hypothetical protein AN416_26050 [Paraburkholderia caribensis]AUT55102.1 hypothetical protein C2L66_25450 [Paraburkholderia caribensis]